MSIDVTQSSKASGRIAAEIRAHMGRQKMSGRELARRLDRSPNWVSLKVGGLQRIDVDDLEAIAEVLGVKMVDLLPSDQRTPTRWQAQSETVSRPNRPRSPLSRPPGRTDSRGPSSRKTYPVAV